MAPKYKLVYFDVKGRGDVIRLLFAAADVKFEDKRIEFSDWPELKPKVPQGSLPVLVIDGKRTLSQSLSIARYLAREFRLMGKKNLETFYVDQIVDTLLDFQLEGFKVFLEKDEEKKKELGTKLQEESFPKYLNILDKAVEASGRQGFAVGSSYTLADFFMFSVLETMTFMTDEVLASYPRLTENKKKFLAHPQIVKYMKTRPPTQF